MLWFFVPELLAYRGRCGGLYPALGGDRECSFVEYVGLWFFLYGVVCAPIVYPFLAVSAGIGALGGALVAKVRNRRR